MWLSAKIAKFDRLGELKTAWIHNTKTMKKNSWP